MSLPKQTAARIVFDAPASGAWNMAVDEALGDDAAQSGQPTLRFYGWSEPTLSLGYFQHYEERQSHRASRDCQVVRRASGGGAIVHDREVTYCLAIPLDNPLARDTTWLYKAVHESLVETLYAREVAAECRRTLPTPAPSDEPFLCFQRQALGDVVLDEFKVCGSAQRRRRGAILQHGSLLLARSEFAPELPGLAELSGLKLDERALVADWSAAIARRLHWRSVAEPLPAALLPVVRTLLIEKYATNHWTLRR